MMAAPSGRNQTKTPLRTTRRGNFLCTRRGAVGISGAPCRGRCPHRPADGQSAPTGETPGVGVGAHCICARGAVAIPAGFPKTYCGTGGYIIRPYRVRCKLVGVDVLIDPSAQRPGGRRAARRSAPTGAVETCRGRCPHRPVPRLGLVEIGADLIHQRHGNLVVAPAAVDGERHLVAG